ncbi:MAG: FHA domain-containing protein [Holophagaceae bacterium]|nr:FHA domain-containing protein [Holophagaceae bacterium]
MNPQPPASTDRPSSLRAAGAAPWEPDQAAKVILDAFDAADRQGSHPASITVQWDDATLALDLQSWRGFQDGSLGLEAVAARLQIQSSGDPEAVAKASAGAAALGRGKVQGNAAPSSSLLSVETLKHPVFLGGCGLLFLLGGCGIVALFIRFLFRRTPAQPAPSTAPSDRPTPAAPPPTRIFPAGAPPRPATALHFLSGPLSGRTVPLGPRVRIGREIVGNDLVLEDASVSRHHALIEGAADGFRVSDLASSNGTFLNGLRLDRPLSLGAGDQLKVGQILIEIR